MAEETRERSTTSAGLWPEAVIGDLNNDSCWLYLMKGLGSDRDKRLALGVLRAFLQTITGEFKVVGPDGTTSITNLLLSMVRSGGRSMELSGQEIKFIDDALEGWIGKFGRAGLEIVTGETEGALKFKISAAGVLTITEGTGQNEKTVTVSKSGVTVTEGGYTATVSKQSLSVTQGTKQAMIGSGQIQVTDSQTGDSTTISDKTVSTRQLVRLYNGTYNGAFSGNLLSASDVVQTLVGVASSIKLYNDVSTTPKFFFDHAPAQGYEIVVDYQNPNFNTLEVFSGSSSGSSESICLQAPNTVRRYRYNGTKWECLY